MRKSLLSITLLALAVLFSCHSGQKSGQQGDDGLTDLERALVAQDTIDVERLVGAFFDKVIEGRPFLAAAMLYTVDMNDPYGEPMPLTNEEMGTIRDMLEALHICDYRIDYMKFSYSHTNEVSCTAIMAPATATSPEVSTHLYFRPVNYLGAWLLCMANTGTGESTIVSPDQREAMTQKYQMEKRQRAQ